MAREKTEIRRIENKVARHVTFSKRRRGLMKKAQELSVLCDADLALIIFSSTEKLFHYCSSSMKLILEKYHKCSNTSMNNEQFTLKALTMCNKHFCKDIQSKNEEMIRIRQRIEDLNRQLRHLHGQDLEGLTMIELQQLENKLEIGLRQICSKKDECFSREIYEHEKQGIQYLEENIRLQRQLEEMETCHVEDDIAQEHLFIELLKTHHHPQPHNSSITKPYNRTYNTLEDNNIHKGNSIIDNEASDTFLQLGLSI